MGDYRNEVLTVPVSVEGSLEKLLGAGRQYALIIANADYSKTAFSTLNTPIDDARELSVMLTKSYGFSTSIKDGEGKIHDLMLVDADRDKITQALETLTEELKPEDSLLVFYAGHGIYEENSQQAFWVPVDASKRTRMISADELTTRFIASMKARHVLVVSDSCYSGALSRGGEAIAPRKGEDQARYIEKMFAKQTRQLLSSGNNEPVSDGGGKGHSIFAQALMDGLKEMEEPLFTVSDLFYGRIKSRVAGARGSNQSPQLQMIKRSGDEGGEFVFRRQ